MKARLLRAAGSALVAASVALERWAWLLRARGRALQFRARQ